MTENVAVPNAGTDWFSGWVSILKVGAAGSPGCVTVNVAFLGVATPTSVTVMCPVLASGEVLAVTLTSIISSESSLSWISYDPNIVNHEASLSALQLRLVVTLKVHHPAE